jgi:hypothetical protein
MTLFSLIKHGFIVYIFTSHFGVLVKLPYYLSMVIGDFKGCMAADISNFQIFITLQMNCIYCL